LKCDVEDCSKEIVGKRVGVEIPVKLQVDVFHRHNLARSRRRLRPPFIPNTAPAKASRRQIIGFLPMWLSACPGDGGSFVLPSPAASG